MEQPNETYDVAVIGAGPAGLAATAALADCGLRTLCVGAPFAPDPIKPDTRTIALMGGSITLLKTLNVWPDCSENAEPLRSIQMIDATSNLLKAPPIVFHASELDLDAFGYNVPNAKLVAALHKKISNHQNADYLETQAVSEIIKESDGAQLSVVTKEGATYCAALVLGADGRNSIVRKSAKIETITWRHDQTALAFDFEHSKPHKNISTEFHRKAGPFTTVPLPGNKSGLVWVETEQKAQQLMSLEDKDLIREMEGLMQGLLGRISNIGPRAAFPLCVQTAKTFGKDKIALIGEAAHVFPPIGAQGLNLSFRDAAMFAECAINAKLHSNAAWAEKAVADYNAKRRVDIWSRTAAVDLLNLSLISNFVPLQAARTAGLHAMRLFGPLRRFTMRKGLDPIANSPKLMQPGISPADLAQ